MNQVHAEGGRAEVGVGFFLAIAAIAVSMLALGGVIFGLLFGYMSTRDHVNATVQAVRDDNIKLEKEIDFLKIELEEIKNRKE